MFQKLFCLNLVLKMKFEKNRHALHLHLTQILIIFDNTPCLKTKIGDNWRDITREVSD